MTVKEFVGSQSEFAEKCVKFTVDDAPLTIRNYDTFRDLTVACWGMRADGMIHIMTVTRDE